MVTIPPYLNKGDTIGLVCPAGYMPVENATTCIQVLQQWGYRVKVGATMGSQYHYFSGTDADRLNDLQQMMDDDNIQAIMCGRGGYGMGRILDQLSFKKFKKHPKWIIGFSDITILHTHLLRRYNIASLHAPMAAAFNNDNYKGPYVQSLRKALAGKPATYTCAVHPYNRPGTATGVLMGGNLSLLCHAIGTPSAPITKGAILFIEDIGEYIYNIDRMLVQLKRSGAFEHLAGLLVGGFTDMKDTAVPFGQDAYEVINSLVDTYNFPVAYNFPVGHQLENYALKSGVVHTMQVSGTRVLLTEQNA